MTRCAQCGGSRDSVLCDCPGEATTETVTMEQMKAAVAELEKAAIKPFEGRYGFIPGHCKDCKHWSKNDSRDLVTIYSDCGAHVTAGGESIDVPEDGSGFCWLFEAKP